MVKANHHFNVGDHVVYRRQKRSAHLGSRAHDLPPAGQDDSNVVDKYWTVIDLPDPGTLTVKTRGGNERRIHRSDPCLRCANFIDELLHHKRFPLVRAK